MLSVPIKTQGRKRHGQGLDRGEDAPLGTRTSNLAMVEEAVRMVRGHGGEPATPAEMRRALAELG
jgi:uncharacterized protein (DUF849 family)